MFKLISQNLQVKLLLPLLFQNQLLLPHHQKMMIYSYAACFAAVTLRIYLPILSILFHDFIKAYILVAWLCWIPNIIVAYFLVQQIQHQKDKKLQQYINSENWSEI